MLAEDVNFYETIEKLNQEELRNLCISLHQENKELRILHAANEKINTEIYGQYQNKASLCEELSKRNKELEKLLEKEINKNSLNAKTTYGRKTESLLSLLNTSSIEPLADIDEAYDTSESNENAQSRVIDFMEIKGRKEGLQKRQGGRKAGKRNPLSESMEKLPKRICYDIDTDSLDEKYGENKWRIVFWHKHKSLEKLSTPYYTKITYTPVISSGLEHDMHTEPFQNLLMDRSVVSASILSDILYRKFVLSLPYYRQAKDFFINGLALSKQNLINWTNKIVPQIFKPIVDHLTDCLLECGYTQNDETYIQVNKDERGPGHKNFMWVHCSSAYLDCNPIIVFCYESTRSTEHLRDFFRESMGYLTCDAYSAYQTLEKERQGEIIVTGCFMHLRRYFAEAFFINDVAKLSDEQILGMPETKVLFKIRDIYRAEKELRDMSSAERLKVRQTSVAPLVDELFAYIHELDDSDMIFTERMKTAITYAVNQESHLKVFLEDGNICIDNGFAERIIRSYSVGRANWLFADTIMGAEVNALVYSVVETAKANGVNVQLYLKYLLEEMPKHLDDSSKDYLKDMVPWSMAYLDYEKKAKESTEALWERMFPEPEAPKTPRKKPQLIKTA